MSSKYFTVCFLIWKNVFWNNLLKVKWLLIFLVGFGRYPFSNNHSYNTMVANETILVKLIVPISMWLHQNFRCLFIFFLTIDNYLTLRGKKGSCSIVFVEEGRFGNYEGKQVFLFLESITSMLCSSCARCGCVVVSRCRLSLSLCGDGTVLAGKFLWWDITYVALESLSS